jgi:hypothetical protein
MNTGITIYYNNKDIFKDIAPTPFVSLSQNYIDFGNKFNQVTSLTLEGQITGTPYPCNFNTLFDSTKKILDDLKDNYKELKILENNTEIYKANIAIIESINFPEDSWYGVLPFNIEFKIYNSEFFQESYGIVSPEENFSFEESNGEFLTLTHTLSAQGIKTENKNAIQNAKDWVNSKKNNFNKIAPILCKDNNNIFLLQTTSEEINRFNGEYSYTAVYKKNIHPENPSNCFLQYSVDVNSNIDDGLVVATINGTLNGNSINILKQEYNKLNLFNLCNTVAFNSFNKRLNNKPIEQSVEELPNENSLTFSAKYNDESLPEIINDYTVTVSTDALNCLSEGEISAKIYGKYGDATARWPGVKNYYEAKFFPAQLFQQEFFKDYESTGAPINTTPSSETISFDESKAEISYNAKYDNKKRAFNEDILSMSSTVSLTPSVNIYAINTAAAVPREHNIQDVACANRAKLNISVTVTAKMNKEIEFAEQEAKKEFDRLKTLYLEGNNIANEEYAVTLTDSIKSVTINGVWSYESDLPEL